MRSTEVWRMFIIRYTLHHSIEALQLEAISSWQTRSQEKHSKDILIIRTRNFTKIALLIAQLNSQLISLNKRYFNIFIQSIWISYYAVQDISKQMADISHNKVRGLHTSSHLNHWIMLFTLQPHSRNWINDFQKMTCNQQLLE